jgi:hypothetical protein
MGYIYGRGREGLEQNKCLQALVSRKPGVIVPQQLVPDCLPRLVLFICGRWERFCPFAARSSRQREVRSDVYITCVRFNEHNQICLAKKHGDYKTSISFTVLFFAGTRFVFCSNRGNKRRIP